MAWRSIQWATFAKKWWLYDANMQCPMLSGEKISIYLTGRHKPLYNKASEVGDPVIVFNTRNIAVKDNSIFWKRFLYTDHTRFGIYRVEQTMEEIHRKDPTKIFYKEVKCNIKNDKFKRNIMLQLHLFPDGIETIPKDLISNVSGVIRQVLPVHKKLSEYSSADIENYPDILNLPIDFNLTDCSTVFKKIN